MNAATFYFYFFFASKFFYTVLAYNNSLTDCKTLSHNSGTLNSLRLYYLTTLKRYFRLKELHLIIIDVSLFNLKLFMKYLI